ncbi:tRNA-binding protein [Rhodocaloribacter sp.]
MGMHERGEVQPDVPFEVFLRLDFRVARVTRAPLAVGTRAPSRVLTLDLGPLGVRTSVAQFALVPEAEMVGQNVIACRNLGVRRVGKYASEALVLGTPHPDNPPGQGQALPLFAHPEAAPGDRVF